MADKKSDGGIITLDTAGEFEDAPLSKVYDSSSIGEFEDIDFNPELKRPLEPETDTLPALGQYAENAISAGGQFAGGLEQMAAEAFTPPSVDDLSSDLTRLGMSTTIAEHGWFQKGVSILDKNNALKRVMEAQLDGYFTPEVSSAIDEGDWVKARDLLARDGLTPRAKEPEFVQKVRQAVHERGVAVSDHFRKQREANQPNVKQDGLLSLTGEAIESAPPTLMAVGASLATRNPRAGVAVMMPYVAGMSYDEARRDGMPVNEAQFKSFYDMLAESAGEASAIEFLSKGKAIWRPLLGALAEGSQEAVTEILQMAYDAGYLGKDMTAEQAIGRVKHAFEVGGLMGFGIGAATATAEGTAKLGGKIYQRQQAKRLDRVDPTTDAGTDSTASDEEAVLGGGEASEEAPPEAAAEDFTAETEEPAPQGTPQDAPQVEPEEVEVATEEEEEIGQSEAEKAFFEEFAAAAQEAELEEEVEEGSAVTDTGLPDEPAANDLNANGVPAPKVAYSDARLKRPEFRSALTGALRSELIPGGNVAYTTDEQGKINGRTKSENPSWVQNLREESGLTIKQMQDAIKKALAGENLGVRQAAVVKGALDQISGERAVNIEHAKAERAEQSAIRRGLPPISVYRSDEDVGNLLDETEYLPEWGRKTRALADVYDLARKIAPDEAMDIIERSGKNGLTDIQIGAQLARLISKKEKANGTQQQTQGETQQAGATGNGSGSSAPEARPGDKAPTEGLLDLLDEDVSGEQSVADAIRDKDKKRSDTKDVPVSAGGGGLFDGSSGQMDIADNAASATKPERRKNPERRKRIEEMSEEEMRRELLTDELTGLGNRRAYNENPRQAHQASLDLDSLKWVNDEMGHESGDALIKALGQALAEEGADAYHPSGDEFWVQGASEAELRDSLERVAARLSGAKLTVTTPSGETITKTGVSFSYGIATDLKQADAKLHEHKEQREREGKRAARGEQPAGIERSRVGQGVAEGESTDQGGAAAEEVAQTSRPASYGAGNKLFTADAAQKAREALKAKLGQLNSGFDPEIAFHGLTLAGFHIEAGARKFADYANAMTEDLGKLREDVLRYFYDAVRKYPGFDAKGMSSDAEIDAYFAADKSEPESVAEPETDKSAEIEAARDEVASEPTDGQKEAGNYKKGHVSLHGYRMSIETAKGGTRSGKDKDGNAWSVEMPVDYGHILGTKGADGDQLDVFLGPEAGNAELPVFVLDQYLDGKFDEHKLFFGFRDRNAAAEAYEDSFTGTAPEFEIVELLLDEAKSWIEQGSIEPHTPREQAAEQPAASSKFPVMDAISQELARGGKLPANNLALKRLVAGTMGVSFDAVTPAQMKQAQEQVEAAIVRHVGTLMQAGSEQAQFDALVAFYNSQPNLNIRTSTSVQNQAYSTPAPLAMIAMRNAGIGQAKSVLEPTAGTGMLIAATKPNSRAKVSVNELEPYRAELLEAQGYQPTRKDAFAEDAFAPKAHAAVIANPPFGAMPEGNKVVRVDGYKLTKIDHVISARSLASMKDDGTGVLIIGANKASGDRGTADRIFFNWLYANYDVRDHFEADGKLYSRQGASWPVAVITVKGRKQTGKLAPDPKGIPRFDTWESIYEHYESSRARVNEPVDTAGTAELSGDGAGGGSAEVAPADATGDVSGSAGGSGGRAGAGGRGGSKGGNRGSDAGQRDGRNGQPQGELGGTDSGKPGDADANQSDRLDGKAGSGSAGVSDKADAKGSDAKKPAGKPLNEEASEHQSEYQGGSANATAGILTPRNLQQPTKQALDKLKEAVGDLDAYVQDKLGYASREALYDAFMGLQIDAVAAAVYQIEQGRAIVIADQTGVGKGRQAAGVLRYARKQGLIPIFLTEKPSLFTDMYNDLTDIGAGDFRPFLMNADRSIKGKDDQPLFANNQAKHGRLLKELTATGALPKNRDALFLTYSQINKPNVQRELLSALAGRAVIVLDESHNAAGASQTGEFVRGIVEQAKGVTYLSATYAKRPDNMPVYFRTDLGKAVDGIDNLISAVTMGGVPLQTVISNQLAKAGQLFRRERSFDGITIATRIDKAGRELHEQLSDRVTESLRAIVDADRAFHAITVKAMDERAKAEGEAVGSGAGNKASGGVDHTQFTSVVHNAVRQLVLAIKADAAAEQAIAAIKRGEKPVIALENTMGSFLAEYVADNGLSDGDALTGFDYRTVLQRMLERTRRVRVTLPNGDEVVKEVGLHELGPIVRPIYDQAAGIIDALDIVEDLPVSPLDWIRHRIEKAGYSIKEITGRGLRVDYSESIPKLAKVSSEEVNDKVRTRNEFNDGKLDAILLNRAGSTGISLHASEKFKDQRPRHMFVAQASLDINVFMQMLGRINRTGQVKLPNYTILNLDLPAEKRPTSVLARKMKSLNANTTANDESDTSVDAPDLFNKYGDQVVAAFLRENEDFNNFLDVDLGDAEKPTEGLAQKATGRLALMPVVEQEAFYAEVENNFTSLIEYLDKTGQNDLRPRTLDLDAKLIDDEVILEGRDPSTVFGQDVVLGAYNVKLQGKPPKWEEVQAAIELNVGESTPAELALAMRKTKRARGDEYRKTLAARVRNAEDQRAKASGSKAAKKAADELDVAARNLQAYDALSARHDGLIKDLQIGKTARLLINEQHYIGVVVNVKDHSTDKATQNPWAGSKTHFTFMVNGGIRQITVPYNRLDGEESILQGMGSTIPAKAAFDRAGEQDERENVFIVTGNLVAGMAEVGSGQVVSFTKEDGEIEQGILLPKKFDPAEQLRGDLPLRYPEAVYELLTENAGKEAMKYGIASRDIAVRVYPRNNSGIVIHVPKSKAKGGKYFLNEKLMAATGGFTSVADRMEATVHGRENAVAALRELLELAPLYAAKSQVDIARAYVDKYKPEVRRSAKKATRSAGMQKADVVSIAHKLIAAWRQRPALKVVQSFGQLSPDLQAELMGKDATAASTTRAFIASYPSGKVEVYLIADNIGDARQVEETVLHEIVGHFGMKNLMGAEFTPLLRQVVMLYGKAGLKDIAADYGLDLSVEADLFEAAEEKLAHLAEENQRPKLIERVLGTIRQWLRRMGFTKLAGKFSEMDLIFLLHRSRQALESGDGPQGGPGGGGIRRSRTRSPRQATPKLTGRTAGGEMAAAASKRGSRWFVYISKSGNGELIPGGPIKQTVSSMQAARNLIESQGLTIERQDPPVSTAQQAPLAEPSFELDDSTLFESVRFHLQDKFIDLKKAQTVIEAGSGPLLDNSNPYQAEELYHGRAEYRVGRFREGFIEPLLKKAKALGVSLDELDEYLYARHAKEVNEKIGKTNLHGKGSGMTDEAADAILDAYQQDGRTAALDELSAMVDRITALHRRQLVSDGLVKDEAVRAWEAKWQFYVPLKGDPTGEAHSRAARGEGFNATAGQKKRHGRSSRAESPLLHLLSAVESDIVRGEKARVARALLRLVQANPNPALWEVDKVKLVPVTDLDGFTQYVASPAPRDAENVLLVDVAGEQHSITFHGDQGRRLAMALRNRGGVGMEALLKYIGGFTRYLALMSTGFNPEFIATNAIRDLQTAGINLTGTELDKLKWKILRDARKAWWGIRLYHGGRRNSAWARLFDQFMAVGGKTGWMDAYNNIEDTRKRLSSALKDMERSGANPIKLFNGLLEFVQNENTAVENAVRLSTYKHALGIGMSPEKAASVAKNLTVNFNRRGNNPWLNALYMFFNASTQGTVRMLSGLKHSKKQRRVVMGLVAFAVVLDILNRLIGDEDEDGVPFYDKLPEYVKSMNMVLMLPGTDGDYIQIPLPYGYNVFHVLGQKVGTGISALADWKKNYNLLEEAASVALSAVNAFNPLGQGTIAQTLAPTAVDPIVQITENKNFAGRDIYPAANPFDKAPPPQSGQGWQSTSDIAKFLAHVANKLSGGTEVTPGMIDVHPQTLEHLARFFTGGAGKFASEMVNVPENVLTMMEGDEVPPYRLPFVGKIWGQAGFQATREEFYDNLRDVKYAEAEADYSIGKRDLSRFLGNKQDLAAQLKLVGAAKKTEDRLRDLNAERKKVRDAKMPAQLRKLREDAIQREIEKTMLRFNRQYYLAIDRYGGS